MRRPAMGIEVLAAFPALDHHEQIRVVDAGVAVIGETAFFLAGCGDAFLGARDEGISLVRLYLRGGDDIDHGLVSRLFLAYRTSTFSGVITSIRGGADMHFTATRPGGTLEHEIALR